MKTLLERLKLVEEINQREIILENKTVVTVWGDGKAESPYERKRYHAGQLSMACAMCSMALLGAKVNVLLTSDNYPRKLQFVNEFLYEQRKEGLINWLRNLVGDNLTFTDSAIRFREIQNNPKYEKILSFWNEAASNLRTFSEKLLGQRDKIDKKEWNEFRNRLEQNCINDSDCSRTTMNGPKTILNWVQQNFNNIKYPEANNDEGALLYLLLIKGGKWIDWINRSWIAECGVVLSVQFGQALAIEAERNMYWLRALRLLHRYTCERKKMKMLFPDIASINNLSNRFMTGPMKSRETNGVVPVLRSEEDIYEALRNANGDFLHEFIIRLNWAKEKIPESEHFLELWSKDKRKELEIGICETITRIGSFWTPERKETLKIGDSFCIQYASEFILELAAKDRWALGISPSIVHDPTKADTNYYKIAELITDKIINLSSHRDVIKARKAVTKLIQHTPDIDVILHMTEKRYRDHGKHQINVAVLGHLLLNSIGPKSNYLYPKKIIDGLTEFWGGITTRDLNAIFLIAAVAHDHGYPLLKVAWLMGKLFSIGFNDGTVDHTTAANLAIALENYIAPFSSKWLQSLLEKIRNTKGCSPIELRNWEPYPRSRAARLLSLSEKKLIEEIKWPSHGLISAINLSEMIADENGGVDDGEDTVLFKVLRAIAIHDSLDIEVNFKQEPVAFFLILCDEIQEWSRRIIWEGKPQIESPYVELVGLNKVDQFTWQLGDILRVHFHHSGIEATNVPWNYNIFRDSKRQSLNRLIGLENNGIFSNRIVFDISIGP